MEEKKLWFPSIRSLLGPSQPLNDADAKWVGLRAIEWQDPTGKARKWECADRKTRKGEVDGKHKTWLLFLLICECWDVVGRRAKRPVQ